MKNIIIKCIMKYISNNTNYSKKKLVEIEYGLTGIYLTLSKIFIICLVSLLIGIFKEMIIFMLFFNVIRTTAFGLHATKSWICLISSLVIFICIPIICVHMIMGKYIKLFIGVLMVLLILKNAPADTIKRPIVSKQRRKVLKIISLIIAIMYLIISLTINNNYISNCLIFSLILENFLISPITYKLFNLPYNNYISFLKSHPDFNI